MCPRLTIVSALATVALEMVTASWAIAQEPAGSEQTAAPTCRSNVSFRADTIAGGLEVPWDLAFTSPNRILLTERPGRIRVVSDGKLLPDVWASLPVAAGGVIGLTGIAVAPDYQESHHVYVAGTFPRDGDSAVSRAIGRIARFVARQFDENAGFTYENRVYRFTDDGEHGTNPELVIDGLPADVWHGTIALEFGPDGLLYVANGYASDPDVAASTDSFAGKILRYRPDGTAADSNPRSDSPVFASGFRQVQALAWHPETGDLFVVDHGEDESDEIDVVLKGKNYGWPETSGFGDSAQSVNPLIAWTPTIAPAGLAFIADGSNPWYGSALVGTLKGEALMRLEPATDSAGGWTIRCQETIVQGEFGRIRAVTLSPGGDILFTTSNRDMRGDERMGDDRLIALKILN